MITRSLFIVTLFLVFAIASAVQANDFKIGEYPVYAIIGEPRLMEDAEYISFTGDFGFRGRIPSDDAMDYHLSNESALLYNFKISVINFEFMLRGLSGQASDIRTDRAMVKILKESGYDLISIANNHAMDYGAEGIRYNRLKLEENGLNIIGTRDFPVYYWKTGGLLIAIIALTDYVDNPDKDRLVLRIDDNDLSLLEEIVRESHFQIAFVHLGSMSSFVSPHEREQVTRLLDAGIDLVVCTGSHFIKGVVALDGKLVAYGLGNHLFSYVNDDTESVGMHLVAGFESGELSQLFVVPFYNSIWKGKTGPLEKHKFDSFVETLKKRSLQERNLYFSDPKNLNKLKGQFSRLSLKNLKNIKFRHLKYAAGIALYNYPVITATVIVVIVVTIGYFGLWIYRINKRHRK